MNDFEIKRVYIYHTYPRDSKINSDKGFKNIDNGSMGGIHWCCFIKKKVKNPNTLIVSEELLIIFY